MNEVQPESATPTQRDSIMGSVLGRLSALVTLLTAFSYVLVRTVCDVFYAPLGLSPEEVGLSQAALLGRAVGLLIFAIALGAVLVMWAIPSLRRLQERRAARRVLARWASEAPIFLSTTKGSSLVETKPKGLLPFAPMAQALADVPAEPDWTWSGYAAPGSITLIAGRPKVGKSTLMFAALEAFCEGRPFLDREAAKSRVLLLSEERQDTLAEKQRRFNLNGSVDLLMRHQVKDTDWPDVVEQAVAYCQLSGITVLVVDTWDKWANLGGDAENSAGHVLTALEPLQRAAAQGLSVLIVAHQRKAHGSHGEAVRGNNALTGSVDVIVEVERPTSEVGPGVRLLKAVSRFSSTPEELAAELTEDGYVARGDEEAVRDRAEKAQAWNAVASLGSAMSKQVADLCGFSDSTARRRLNQLVEDGTATCAGEGGKGDPFTWRVIGSTSPYSLGGGKKKVDAE